MISGGARVIGNDPHWLVGRNFVNLNSLRSDIILRQILPSFCGLLVAFSYSFVLKSFANGGPIISDEWGYLGPTRNSSTSNLPITTAGNHLYSYLILFFTNNSPLSQQIGYVLFNLFLFFGTLIVFCALIDTVGIRRKILVCSTIGISGTTLFISALMPEILTIFLCVVSLFFLRYLTISPKIFTFLLLLISLLGPFVKIHLILLSIALIAQLVVIFFTASIRLRVDMLLGGSFSGLVSILLLFFTIDRNSYISYSSKVTAVEFTFSSLLNLFLLILCAISMICLLTGRSFMALEIDGAGRTERVFIRTLTLGSVVTFSYFSWFASSLGAFEENRLHGRYFLPLIFVLLTYIVDYQSEDVKRLRINLSISFLSLCFLLVSGLSYLNIYPWDVPFLFGLFSGKSPWGWEFGKVPPLFIFLLLFLLFAFAFLLVFVGRNATVSINVAMILALTFSSTIGVSEWVKFNGDGAPGAAIDWALANPTAECFPATFPEYAVNTNLIRVLSPCD